MAFLPVILAAATEHSVETEGNLLGQFGIEGPFLLSQIISFCVVAFVLYRFAFKPVLATIDERQKNRRRAEIRRRNEG
jgi:F-type H+-transporting ATPase subunit b